MSNEASDIQKAKNKLIARAKAKGLSENFGQKEVGDLEKKYGRSVAVQEFDNWVMNFDVSQFGSGGSLSNFFSKAKSSVKGAASKVKSYTNNKIHDEKKKVALGVLSEMGMRANVTPRQEQKIINPAYDLVYELYENGGTVYTWTATESNLANQQGWNIFDGMNGYEIQRLDENPVFEGDASAWRFVVEKANEGSELHKAAIEFIKDRNIKHYNRINDLASVKFKNGGTLPTTNSFYWYW